MNLRILESEEDIKVIDVIEDELVELGEDSVFLNQAVKDLVSGNGNRNGKLRLVFNFSRVRKIDSWGLAALVSAYTFAKYNQAKVNLVALGNVKQTIVNARMWGVNFELYSSEKEAIEALEEKPFPFKVASSLDERKKKFSDEGFLI